MNDIVMKRFQAFVVFLYIAFLLYCAIPSETVLEIVKASEKVNLSVKSAFPILFLMAGLGQLLISPFMYYIKTLIHGNRGFKESQILIPAIMGYIESFLYPTAFLMEQTLFIPFWLTLKAVRDWPAWKDEKKGRESHAKYLIGNGLMILWGLITYGLIVSILLR